MLGGKEAVFSKIERMYVRLLHNKFKLEKIVLAALHFAIALFHIVHTNLFKIHVSECNDYENIKYFDEIYVKPEEIV